MAGRKPPRVVHQLDQHTRPDGTGQFRRVRAVCGVWVYPKYATTMVWKVTCDVCNPPTRRKVRVRPRPAPAAPDLEMA